MQLKRITYCFILLFVANNLFAQEEKLPRISDKNHHFSLNVLTPFVNTFSLSYEHKRNDDEAIVFNMMYFQSDNLNVLRTHPRAVSFAIEYKYYLTNYFPQGLFIQPFGRYAHFWGRNTTNTYPAQFVTNRYNFLFAGILIGEQYALKDMVTFQYFGGPYYGIPLNNAEEFKSNSRPVNGWFYIIGASVGILIK